MSVIRHRAFILFMTFGVTMTSVYLFQQVFLPSNRIWGSRTLAPVRLAYPGQQSTSTLRRWANPLTANILHIQHGEHTIRSRRPSSTFHFYLASCCLIIIIHATESEISAYLANKTSGKKPVKLYY